MQEGQDTEADVTRAIVADEELLELQALAGAAARRRPGAAADAEEQPEASTSYSLDSMEQVRGAWLLACWCLVAPMLRTACMRFATPHLPVRPR